jgi:hypothetical protein
VDHLVDLIASTLGLDHDRVLMGRNALPVLGRLLLKNNGRFADATEAGRALYWYVHAAVRGRFAGSTETFLAKDLETVDRHGIDGVIDSLRRACNGRLTIDAQDFEGAGRGSRSYPLLYLAGPHRRGQGPRDRRPLGTDSGAVEVCEIFPRAVLAEAGYSRPRSTRWRTTRWSPPRCRRRCPAAIRPSFLAAVDPAVRASQWIPTATGGWQTTRSSSRPGGSSWPPRPTRSSAPVDARAAAAAGAGHAHPRGRVR